MNVSEFELDELPEDEPEPLEDDPEPPEEDPVPPVTVPPGRIKFDPLVENTTFPFTSVLYTEIPAEERLLSAVDVG